ncbi:MAG: DegT/DnrJ/EryC1/StrS family aminotransferase [Candidatus Omnitrophica bacterium]|nr:DegT/DnrJ/EryC1/StrS family aminotransferase [Candidatus Omnitrophota bacterium]
MSAHTTAARPDAAQPSYRITFGHIEIGEAGRRFLSEALSRNWVSEGPNVRRFEAGFARKFGYGHAVATSSGTDAGIVAMSALLERGAKRGEEVITPALAFVSTANCILAAGLVPRFVDVELETLNIDPAKMEAAMTSKTRAIQVVHTMGKPCAMGEILAIAKRHHLLVIEDCCEAHGATLNGQVIGSFGAMGLFSFYAAHLICSGEGGMISTNDAELAGLCRSIRSHGRRGGQPYFHFDQVGFNSKMNDLEAAIGLEGLELFDQTFAIRRRHLARLRELLSPLEDRVILYPDGRGEVISPHAMPLVLRDERASIEPLYRHLEHAGIQCKTLFGSLPTQHRAFAFLGYRPGDFPVAERIGRTGLHFGVHQYLTEDDVEYAADTVRSYFTRSNAMSHSRSR